MPMFAELGIISSTNADKSVITMHHARNPRPDGHDGLPSTPAELYCTVPLPPLLLLSLRANFTRRGVSRFILWGEA